MYLTPDQVAGQRSVVRYRSPGTLQIPTLRPSEEILQEIVELEEQDTAKAEEGDGAWGIRDMRGIRTRVGGGGAGGNGNEI